MRETKSARLTRMHDEYDILRQVIPAPACALHFSNPLELLIATVLSAQTTDKRVNTVTPELFATYPTARDLAAANPAQVEDIIHPLGFYRSKTQHLIGLATALDERFGGVVPRTMESSTSTTRLPLTIVRTAESFMRTPFSRSSCEGWMNVRPMYLFLISPISYGRPLASA